MVASLPTIFFFGMITYFVIMALVGYLASRKLQTMEDYLIAGRQLPFFLALPTIVATWFGAGSCMGVSGTVYSKGFYGVIPDPFGCSLALLIAGLFFAPSFRRLNLWTLSDLLKRAYGSNFEKVATLLMLPFYIGTLASQMLAMGYVFKIISGMNSEFGIFWGSLIVVFYTVSGGMWAVTITDFIQLGLLIIGLALVVPTALDQVADTKAVLNNFWDEFGKLLPNQNSESTWLSYIGRILMTGLGAIMGQDIIQRLVSCRSVAVARFSALGGSLVYLLLGMIPLLIGIVGREIFPKLDNPELLLPMLAKEFLSPIAFTLFACGLFSAIMSTADSYLLAGTSLITHNLILPLWPVKEEKAKINLVRLVNIVLAFIAFGLALSKQNIFDLMVHSGATLFVAIFVPTSAALFWKKANSIGAWFGLAGGILSWLSFIIYHLYKEIFTNYEDLLFSAAAFGGAGSFASYMLTTYLYKSTIDEKGYV